MDKLVSEYELDLEKLQNMKNSDEKPQFAIDKETVKTYSQN